MSSSFLVSFGCPRKRFSERTVRNSKKWFCQERTLVNCSSPDVSDHGQDHKLKMRSGKERVKDVVVRQAALVSVRTREKTKAVKWDIDEAYERCMGLASMEASTILLTTSSHPVFSSILSVFIRIGLFILGHKQEKHLAAIVVWFRRTDELVDGINGSCTTLEVIDKWEEKLVDLFQGRPHDMLDAALSDTVQMHQLDIQLFKDFIEGMRLDLRKQRATTFDELYLYCYYIAGTVAIMVVQVMGISPESEASLESIYDATISFAISLQLQDILRDVGEDITLGRVYLPRDELASAGLSEEDVLSGKVTVKWRNFMKEQIKRARIFAKEGEKLIPELNPEDRWISWLLMLLNHEILNSIEANDYSFKKHASVGILNQVQAVLKALAKTRADLPKVIFKSIMR